MDYNPHDGLIITLQPRYNGKGHCGSESGRPCRLQPAIFNLERGHARRSSEAQRSLGELGAIATALPATV